MSVPATDLPLQRDLSLHGARTFEPPYDDETGTCGGPVTDGSLALALTLRRAEEPPTLRLVPGGRARTPRRRKAATPTAAVPPAQEVIADDDPLDDIALPPAVRTPRAELPPPRVFGARLVQHLTEATTGQRPLSQLSPYLSRAVYQRLERLLMSTTRATWASGQDTRASVRSVHVCEPNDGVAELAAVVRKGGRMAAVALRLEGIDGRWQCTALQMT